MDGFLVSFWCYYIVIMVVVCYQCFYLVGFYMVEFLQIGGDFEWLLGFYWVFEKLCKFSEINKLLVYWLWFIIKEYIQVLLKIGEYIWFLVEFIQVLVLFIYCYLFLFFVFGCGIFFEGDVDGSFVFQVFIFFSEQSSFLSRDLLNNFGGFEFVCEVEVLMECMWQLQESLLWDEGMFQEEMESCFELEKLESLLVIFLVDILEFFLYLDMLCFVEDFIFGYEDFIWRGVQVFFIFWVQDYIWEDYGYLLIQWFYFEGGQLLDEKFQVVYSFIYNIIVMYSGVDIFVFCRVIWNYIYCVFGIRYDDYDYGEVNQFLEWNFKVYIKIVVCYLEKII